MSSALQSPTDCCQTCGDVETVNIPGSSGAGGAAGANGLDGLSAYSQLTEILVLPAEGATVIAEVDQNAWVVLGHIVVVQAPVVGAFGTFMQATAKPDSTHITLKNIKNTGTGDYVNNPAPGTNYPVGYLIAPAGPQGPTGASGSSGAPTTATFVLITADASLPGATVLNGMGSGAMVFNDSTNAISAATTGLSVAMGGTGATSATNARTSLGAAKSGANSDITSLTGITTPLPISEGGTGGATAGDARTNLSAAKSGANSDITSISALSTALSVVQGGTGANNAADARTNLGISGSAVYNSALLALPAAGAAITPVAHGFGSAPKVVECWIYCVENEATSSYDNGEVIPAGNFFVEATVGGVTAWLPAFVYFADDTDIYCYRHTGNLLVRPANEGAAWVDVHLVDDHFNLRVRASLS